MIKNVIFSVSLYSLQILNFLHSVQCIEPPDLTLVVKNNDVNNVELICIAEGNVLNSAIGWIYPLVDTKDNLPEIVSTYVPEIKNDYNCDFSKTKICNNAWQQMKDWRYSQYDAHNFKLTLDNRWEDFQTLITSETTKEFNTRIEIPQRFQIGFSVRASKVAEVFLCEGWKPQIYPCYYINIGGNDNKQLYLKKFKSVPDNFSMNDSKFKKYKSDVSLLNEEEWRNFVLSLDETGTLILTEKQKGTVLLNSTDKEPYKPTYLLIRSKNDTALWKIHKNWYIFTNKTRTTQLGPSFEIYGTDLCVSLHISMCQYCKMTFFMLENGKMKVIKEVVNEDNEKELVWNEIRIYQKDILNDKLKLFIKTEFVNNTLRSGFWAIDDVRICAENEIRTIHMQTKKSMQVIEKSHFSCQALNFPSWRPPQHYFIKSSVDMSFVSSNSSSIKLSWKGSSDKMDTYRGYYVINYEGQDLCSNQGNTNEQPKSKTRLRSQGYILSKSNELTINMLVPYTNYNITLWNIIDKIKTTRIMNTLPTDKPTKEEVPRDLRIYPTDTSSKIVWRPKMCNETYGPIIYSISLKNQNGKDKRTFMDVKTNYVVENLSPFTNYSVEIHTARDMRNLNEKNSFIITIHNFTTLPGIALQIENLEMYAIDRQNAYMRFDLPKHINGLPKYVQVQWCHPLYANGCNSIIQNLTKCKLWIQKYCVEVNQLSANFNYTFLVSIKNDNTSAFGKEQFITGKATERIPGAPENVTYEMVNCDKKQNYCHVKITWQHPYSQNATITAFDILLTEISLTNTTDILKTIQEILKVNHKQYQSTYSYMIKFIPFNTPYNISVRAVNNGYKGKFSTININVNNVENYVDSTPEFVKCTNETIQFKLPILDWRLNLSTLIVIIQDYDINVHHIAEEVVNLEMFIGKNQLCNNYGNIWIAMAVKVADLKSSIITIGDKTTSYLSLLNKSIFNKPLTPASEYCVTFTLLYQHEHLEDVVVYHEKSLFTSPTIWTSQQNDEAEKTTNAAAYLIPVLFMLLLIATSAWLTYRYLKKRKQRNGDVDHIYESMPFEDYLPQAVSNQSYDRLIHD